MFRQRIQFALIAYFLVFVGTIALPVWVNAEEVSGRGEVAVQTININTASQGDLVKLKRIGPVIAGRIIEYREKHGPFQKPEDIMKVRGIGPKTWEDNKDLITVK